DRCNGRRAARADCRPRETARGAKDLLRQPAADDRETLGRRPEGAGQVVWPGDEKGRRNPVSVRRPARAPRTIDCLCALERRHSAVVEVGCVTTWVVATPADSPAQLCGASSRASLCGLPQTGAECRIPTARRPSPGRPVL